MGYQALLFCPDEKTARTVTQVLTELEFSVESCTEPFAAVKKLMGQHFDAIVVDCDNEQNATLLFKSARNSTANQASLAVAVVEGQAGVAKAFRIGANLVLTKPINVEQAKGTLRVARGLLRKGDPAKATGIAPPSPVVPSSSPAPAPATPTARRDAPSGPSRSFAGPIAPPTMGGSMRAANAPSPASDDDDVIDIGKPAAAPTRNTAVAPSTFTAGQLSGSEAPPVPRESHTAIKSTKDIFQTQSAASTGSAFQGAGGAAAPARSLQKSAAEKGTDPNVVRGAEPLFDKGDLGRVESSVSFAAPSFSFGGANAAEEPAGGGSKKALIGFAAAVVFAAALYAGWARLHGKPSSQEESPKISAAAHVTTQTPQAPRVMASPKQASELEQPSSAPMEPTSQPNPEKLPDIWVADSTVRSSDKPTAAKGATKTSASTTAKSSFDPPPAVQPIVVKNGTTVSPAHTPPPTSDAAAPSVLDIAPSTSGGSLSNLISNPSDTSKPVLETLNVSQGVSQGLLIKKVQPIYPPAAIRMHVEGSVQLLATIGKTGNIAAVKVESGEPLLAQSALDAVKQWKYKPYYLNGDPVEIQTQVTINFKLPK